jgi:hypothetical protein
LVTPSKLASRCPVLTTASVAPTPTSLAKPPLLQIGWGRALAVLMRAAPGGGRYPCQRDRKKGSGVVHDAAIT